MFPDPAPGRTTSTPLRLGAIYRSMGICEDDNEKWASVWPKRLAKDACPSRRDGVQSSVLVNKGAPSMVSNGHAASGRTDRSGPRLPPSLIAPSGTLTPPGIRSPSTAIAGGLVGLRHRREQERNPLWPGPGCLSFVEILWGLAALIVYPWTPSSLSLSGPSIPVRCACSTFNVRASEEVACRNRQHGYLTWQRTRDDGLVDPGEGSEHTSAQERPVYLQ